MFSLIKTIWVGVSVIIGEENQWSVSLWVVK